MTQVKHHQLFRHHFPHDDGNNVVNYLLQQLIHALVFISFQMKLTWISKFNIFF